MSGYPDTIDSVASATDLIVGTVPPTSTYNGLHWLDSNKSPPELNIFANGAWQKIGGSGASPSLVAPATPTIGALWYDLTNQQAKLYAGAVTGWLVIPSSGDLATAIRAEITRSDTAFVDVAGDTMTGPLVLAADPTLTMEASTKNYVDTEITKLTNTATATYETQADHATDKAAEITRADAKYVPKSQLATASTGAPTASRVVETDSNGKIDGSFLNIPGGMVYKGTKAATDTAPASPSVGDFYLFSTSGTPTGWTGITNPLKAGEAALWDGTKWDVLASSTDVNAVYTKTESDAKYYTLAAQTLDSATQVAVNAALTKATTDEVTRAKAAELKLTNDLAAEVARADAAEKVNAAAITALTTRVAALEAKLASVTGTPTSIRVAGTIEATGDITAFKP